MSEGISVGHPFYFPTQVVLVDDDPDFLDGISLMLDKNLSFKLFQSANAALGYVNNAHRHVNFLQRCYANYKTGPLESDSLSHIDIGKLHHEVLNWSRFQTCSTVVVDYSMPEMNGLEFLMKMTNPFIRKVLLTGQADMELAVKAFNQQLIDQFIDKHDPRLKKKLNGTIATFQDQYFRSSFKLITDPIIANNQDAFLVNSEFQEFFRELRTKTGCIEYYMLDSPHSGFLMVDGDGKKQCLLIYHQEALASHCEQLESAGAPAELLSKVKVGKLLPVFDVLGVELNASHPFLAQWNLYYFPAHEIKSRGFSYFTTITNDECLPHIHGKQVFSFNNFMESNPVLPQIVH